LRLLCQVILNRLRLIVQRKVLAAGISSRSLKRAQGSDIQCLDLFYAKESVLVFTNRYEPNRNQVYIINNINMI